MSRRLYRGTRLAHGEPLCLASDLAGSYSLDPQHSVWVFGDGSMDWTTKNGAKQVSLALLTDATESIAVATLWCEDYADSFFGDQGMAASWTTNSENICRWIIDRVKDELFGCMPVSAALGYNAEVNGDGHV